MVTHHVPIKPTGAHPIDPILWRPMALLVTDHERAVAIDANAIRSTESTGDDLSFRAVSADFEQGPVLRHQRVLGMPASLGVIEVSGLICLQIHGEFVEMLRDLSVVVETLVEVRFAITVEI